MRKRPTALCVPSCSSFPAERRVLGRSSAGRGGFVRLLGETASITTPLATDIFLQHLFFLFFSGLFLSTVTLKTKEQMALLLGTLRQTCAPVGRARGAKLIKREFLTHRISSLWCECFRPNTPCCSSETLRGHDECLGLHPSPLHRSFIKLKALGVFKTTRFELNPQGNLRLWSC